MLESVACPPLDMIHTIAFDFDGVFTDNTVWVDEDGRESVRCDRADGLAIDMLRAAQRKGLLQADFFIVSSEHNPVVSARAKKLGLCCHQGVGDKLDFVRRLLVRRFPENQAPLSGLVYLGNDVNDLSLMQSAGFAVAPSDAHPSVQEIADLVFDRRGGSGFVRAFVERMLDFDRLAPEGIDEYVSDS